MTTHALPNPLAPHDPLAAHDPNDPSDPTRKPTRGRKVRDLAIGLVVLGAAVVGATFFLAYKRPEAESPKPSLHVEGDAVHLPADAPAHRYLDFDTAALGDPIPSVPAPGRVEVDELRVTRIMPPLAGRVESAPVRTGQAVKTGDLLVSVRSGALGDLDTEVSQAEAALTAASRARDRIQKLVDASAAAAKDLVDADRDVRIASLALAAAKNRKKALSLDVAAPGTYRLLAPADGVVLTRDVSLGEQVSPERGTPLVTLADLDEVLVMASVTENDAVNLRAGASCKVRALGAEARQIEATIDQVSDVVDPVRRTVEVRVRVPNPSHALRVNAFVEVDFEPAQGRRVVIPQQAVVTDNEISVVFVKDPSSDKIARREVKLGRQRDGKAEVLAGLAPGEVFAAKGALLLLNAIDLTR
ncbi:MAG: efflux RND transporter periplasmic adaptor subunit [Deltaproteobacteria bacterium]|jgi:cobalt-zinc-cadmium efflux system membrane fusion protein|nr:efflux RND transporter periplasmic adaptor subunit [Deltaproteobacteria bacterium]